MGVAARISETFLIQRIRKVLFFYKESKSNKKYKKKILAVRRGGSWCVARVSDLVFLFSKEFKSEKKFVLFEGVKVRVDWLV